MLPNQYSIYSWEESQLWAGVHIRTPELTFHFPYEEPEDSDGEGSAQVGLCQLTVRVEAGFRIQGLEVLGFHHPSLPVPAWGPGLSTAEQDVAGKHESRGKGIHEAKLASGSKSLLPLLLGLLWPVIPPFPEVGGFPQQCLQNPPGSQ